VQHAKLGADTGHELCFIECIYWFICRLSQYARCNKFRNVCL